MDENIFSRSAAVAFYFSFSIFPLLLFLVAIFGLTLDSADDLRLQLFLYLHGIMPPTAFKLVQETLSETINESSSGVLTIGFVVAVWSASAAFDGLRNALNSVYNIRETRTWWQTRLNVLLLTIVIGVLILTALSFIFYGSQLVERFLPIQSELMLKTLAWATIVIALLLAFMLLYNYLPDHPAAKGRWITPGAVFAIVFWLAVSGGFRLYLVYFDNYSRLYGSLGAMIILMLWLYLTAFGILLGGVINALLWEVNKPNPIEPEPAEEIETAEQTF